MLALAAAALGAGEVEPDAVDILETTSDSEEIRSVKKIVLAAVIMLNRHSCVKSQFFRALIHGRWYVHVLSLLTSMCSLSGP